MLLRRKAKAKQICWLVSGCDNASDMHKVPGNYVLMTSMKPVMESRRYKMTNEEGEELDVIISRDRTKTFYDVYVYNPIQNEKSFGGALFSIPLKGGEVVKSADWWIGGSHLIKKQFKKIGDMEQVGVAHVPVYNERYLQIRAYYVDLKRLKKHMGRVDYNAAMHYITEVKPTVNQFKEWVGVK